MKTDDINPQVLKRIHELLAQLLAEFDRVCTELNVSYAVYGGTAIGAVRHQGFIPWDDDVDVMMPRADYERFLKDAPALLGERFRVDNTRTVRDYPFMFSKLVLAGTLLVPEFAKDSKYRMPISLDILPVDNVPDSDRAFRAMSRRTWLWGRLLFLQGTPRPYLIGITGARRAAIYSATTAAHWVIRLLHLTPQFLQGRWERAARSYEHASTTRMADFSMRDPQNWSLTREEFYPLRKVPFEGIMVKLPNEYDALLRRGYGDYMQLPPQQQRRNHKPHTADFGPYTNGLQPIKEGEQ